MESLPTLQSLHQALTSEDALEAEDELLSVISHLLVCAIEDPGVPNPIRHTTLLGQSLRTADITNSNISEILRIYLYAVATGEVRNLNGVTLDRERERRVADHHLMDTEQMLSSGKNQAYYEALQQNQTWKLSECLKDKPFVSLNPTVKTEILVHLCNDLLTNKAVVRQIENSLEAVAQHKRDRYGIENRVRKYKHLHARKVRMEQFEKQQAIARQIQQQQFAQAQAAQAAAAAAAAAAAKDVTACDTNEDAEASEVADSCIENADKSETSLIKHPSNLSNVSNVDLTDAADLSNHKEDSMQSTDVSIVEKVGDDGDAKNKSIGDEHKPSGSGVDASPTLNNGATTPDITNLMHKKINNVSAVDVSTGDVNLDDDLSDIESEGTILEEDEDLRMTSEEVYKKLEKIIKVANQNKTLIEQSSNSLRATCYGQDRFWRRYWHLPKTGGIYVEGLESAQPELLKYHMKLEDINIQNELLKAKENANECESKRRGKKRKLSLNDVESNAAVDSVDALPNSTDTTSQQDESIEIDDNNIDESINDAKDNDDSDSKSVHSVDDASNDTNQNGTQYGDQSAETNADNKIASTQSVNQTAEMLDIEDSIPRAILVQKANENDETVVEVNNQVGGIDLSAKQTEQTVAEDNVVAIDEDSTHKMNCDSKSNHENGSKADANALSDQKPIVAVIDLVDNDTDSESAKNGAPLKSDGTDGVKVEIKDELTEDDLKREEPEILDKWFSIANREIQLSSIETQIPLSAQAEYSNITCEMIMSCQGNRWDIANNSYYFHVPVESPINLQINRDSVLSQSGIDEKAMDKVLTGVIPNDPIPDEPVTVEIEEDDNKIKCLELMKMEPETQPFQLPSLLNMSFANLSAFVQCDSTIPLQMTVDEQKMLEEVKVNGLPRRLEGNYVTRETCHGFWKINDMEVFNEVIQCLHVKGVRERELRANLLQALTESIDLGTPCHVANLRSPPPAKGYIDPEPMNVWNPQVARRVELALLDQVESLEDKIAGASMQIKGWSAPTRDLESENELDLITGIQHIRDRILGLEAAIERRYLKPPLGTSTAESNIAAITTQSVTLSSTREITTTIQTTGNTSTVISSSSLLNNDDQNSSSGSVTTTPEREVLPKGKLAARFKMISQLLNEFNR